MASEELHQGAKGDVFHFARILRKEQTRAEELLWNQLRSQKLDGYKFRRQHPIKNWIADFYCHEAKLVIEVDGRIHLDKQQKGNDEGRTYELEGLGLKVIRFTNEEVESNIENVLKQIKNYLIPDPSPKGEGKV
jgi:very-short-patch-repair endonuclease